MQHLDSLPGVVFLAQGENFTARSLGYNYAISVRFTSKEAEASYQSLPLHVKIRDEIIKPNLDTDQTSPILVMDIEHTKRPRGLSLLALGLTAGFCVGMLVAKKTR